MNTNRIKPKAIPQCDRWSGFYLSLKTVDYPKLLTMPFLCAIITLNGERIRSKYETNPILKARMSICLEALACLLETQYIYCIHMVTCICGNMQKRSGKWDITLLIALVLPSGFYESSKNRARERERKMNKTYKPSMFNYILDDDEKLILYNSFVGVKSILTVTKQNQEHVKSVLAPGMLIDNPGNIERCLIEHGLLVPTEENEKTKRDFLLSQIVNSNTLELVITVTEKCNFVCKYCSLDFAKGKMSVTVQDNIFTFHLENIYIYQFNYTMRL